MSSSLDHTGDLASFILDTSDDDIPTAARDAALRVAVDTLACTIAGYDTDLGRRVAQLKIDQSGTGDATLFVTGDRLPVASVAYAHVPMANALDADETLFHTAHFANLAFLPALAVAEREGVSGRDVLTAFCLGFDVAARVGLAMPTYQPSDTSIRFNGFSWAVFSTVAAVGRLIGLTHDQMRHALGIAYDTTPIRPPMRSLAALPMLKYTPYGPIAEAGVNAAFLAARGFTGNSAVFRRDYDFWSAFGAQMYSWDFMLANLGTRWFVAETSLKPYPVARPITLPIDLLLRIMSREGLEVDEIEEVLVRLSPTTPNQVLSQPAVPSEGVGTSFSLLLGLALAAAGPAPGPKWHEPGRSTDPAIRAFVERIRTETVDGWGSAVTEQLESYGYFRRMPTEVQVRARGEVLTAYGDSAKGDPWDDDRAMTAQEIETKFIEFVTPALGPDQARKALAEAWALGEARSVSNLAMACISNR